MLFLQVQSACPILWGKPGILDAMLCKTINIPKDVLIVLFINKNNAAVKYSSAFFCSQSLTSWDCASTALKKVQLSWL